jgi:hypothetical protein
MDHVVHEGAIAQGPSAIMEAAAKAHYVNVEDHAGVCSAIMVVIVQVPSVTMVVGVDH